MVTASYAVNFNSQQCDNGQNLVQIIGLNAPNFESFAVPLINFFGSTGPLEIIINPANNQIELFAQGDIVFQGPIDLFFADPPPEFCLDFETCRTFTKASNPLTDKSVFVEAPALSRLFDIPFGDPGCDTLDVFDNNTGEAIWDAVIDGSGIVLPNASGMGELEFCYDNLAALRSSRHNDNLCACKLPRCACHQKSARCYSGKS